MKTIHFNEDVIIEIGKNQLENQLLLDTMDSNNTWFHLADYPSAHLVINVNYNCLNKKEIYQIASLLKQNSKYKKTNNIAINYTLRKDLVLTDIAGQVILNKYKTINV